MLAQQGVICDASGGSFRLIFNGYTTSTIAYNANAQTIQTILEELAVINNVTIAFHSSSYPYACINQYSSGSTVGGGGFTVTFNSVVNMAGNLPLMTAYTNNLLGLRYVKVTNKQTGNAPIGGSYRLSYLGQTTTAINPTSISSLTSALIGLESFPTTSFTVAQEMPINPDQGYMYTVTFSSALYGNVEALEVVAQYNLVTGSNANVAVLSGGAGSLNYAILSAAGNQLSGRHVFDCLVFLTVHLHYISLSTVLRLFFFLCT